MGFGDALMASAQARVLNETTGKKIAIGDGKSLPWKAPEVEVFRSNPRLAIQADLDNGEVEWIVNWSGHRPYVDRKRMEREFAEAYPGRKFTMKDRMLPWRFTDWQVPGPGEIYFNQPEISRARERFAGKTFAVVEPRMKRGASPNKVWLSDRYRDVVSKLRMSFVQFNPDPPLPGAWVVRTATFREACAILSLASLYIGTEGGLAHAAAALGVPSVVYHGGYIRPWDYPRQVALYREEGSPCGMRIECKHCREIARDITADEALRGIEQVMDGEAG